MLNIALIKFGKVRFDKKIMKLGEQKLIAILCNYKSVFNNFSNAQWEGMGANNLVFSGESKGILAEIFAVICT